MQYCPACGSRVEPSDVHCYNCGQQLDDAGTASSGQSGPYDERKRRGRGYETGGPESPSDQGRAGRPDQGQPDQSAYGPWESNRQYGSGGPSNEQYNAGGPPNDQYQTGGPADQQYHAGGGYGPQQQGYQQQYGGPQQPYPQEQQFSEQDRQYIEDGKLSYSFKFPLTDQYDPLMLGAACYFLGSWIIVSMFTLLGYTFRMVEAAAYGDTIQPAFDEYLELTKEGFLYWLLFMLYFTVPTVLSIGLAVLGDQFGLTSAAWVGIAVTWLVFGYFAPAVFTLYPVTRSFSAAISPGNIAAFAFSKRYFASFLVFTALSIGLSLVSVFLFFMLLFTIVGIVLVFFIVPYLYYAYASFWGATYYEAVQDGVVPEPDGPQPAAEPSSGEQYQH